LEKEVQQELESRQGEETFKQRMRDAIQAYLDRPDLEDLNIPPERIEAADKVYDCLAERRELYLFESYRGRSDGAIEGLSKEYLAELTGLSLSQVKQAVQDLRAAGHIKGGRP
jgi:hypothetical protein